MKKFIPILVICTLSLIVFSFDLHEFFTLEQFKHNKIIIDTFVETQIISAIIIYSTTYILGVALSLPIATFLTLLGGILFGQWIGTITVVLSATFGSTILFISAKMASKDILTKKIGGFAKKMQKGFKKNALSYLLTLRLIPLFPFVMVNLVAALLQIPLRTYILGTAIGIMPGSFIYVSIGVAISTLIEQPGFELNVILEPKVLMALTGLGILSLLPMIYKYLKNKH